MDRRRIGESAQNQVVGTTGRPQQHHRHWDTTASLIAFRRGTGMRLLVVEDDPKLAVVLRQGLKEHGFAVDVARDGIAGLDLAVTNDYDAVVLDVMLPGRDGFDVRERTGGGLAVRDAQCARVRRPIERGASPLQRK